MIIKIYGIDALQYHELDIFMKNRTNEIIFIPNENSIKIVMKFSNAYSPEEVLAYMCRKIDFFEENLIKALNKEKSASDIDFEEKMLKILGENKSKKYGISSENPVSSEKIFEEVKPEKTTWTSEKIYGDYVDFNDNPQNKNIFRILKKVLIPTIVFCIIYLSFYIAHGYILGNKFTNVILLLCVAFFIAFLWIEHSLPSYVLTKKIGLREKIGEKFYGTFSNGISFCVTPYNGRRFLKDEFFFNGYSRKQTVWYKLNFKIKLENGEEYYCRDLIIQREIANVTLEGEVNTCLKTIAKAYGIEDEIFLSNCNYKYNFFAIIFNILTFRRCISFLYLFFPYFFTISIGYYASMIYEFIVDFIRYL